MNTPHWQSLIILGNKYYHKQQWKIAEHFYADAYDILGNKYRENPLSANILMSWICVCHNLSSLYETLENYRLALKFLLVPHDYLKDASENSNLNEEEKVIAVQALSLTLPAIVEFSKKHQVCQDCMDTYSNIKPQLSHSEKVIH